MDSYAVRLLVDALGPRPPFGEVVDHVYGVGANVDTDGDSSTPGATDWTWLYMCQRPTRDASVVEVTLSDERDNIMIVASEDEALAQRTAVFLALRAGGRVTSDPVP